MNVEYNAESAKTLKIAKEATKGSLFIFTGNTLSTIILTITSIIIARLLGPTDYGLYSVALIPSSLMLLFTDFGVKPALVRFTARFRSENKTKFMESLIKTGFLFEFAISLLVFVLTFLLADILATNLLNRPGIGFFIRLSSLMIIGNVLTLTSNSIFNGLDKMDRTAIISVIQAIVKMTLAPIFIILGFSVVGALTGHILGYIVAGVIGTIMILGTFKYPKHNSDNSPGVFANLIFMVRYGMPLYASSLIAGLLRQYRSIVLAWFISNTEIGNYSAAVKFTAIITILTIPISTALFPTFSKLNPKRNMHSLKILFANSLKYTLLLIIPTSTFTAFNSKDLVALFYGSSYTQASVYLTLYSITFLYTGFSLVLTSFFNGIGRTDISLKTTIIQIPAIILLVPTFTWLYKVQGFIYALVVSGMMAIAYLIWIAYRKYHLEFNPKCIIKICIASLLSSVPTFILTSYLPYSHLTKLVLVTANFLPIYLTIIPIVGAIKNEDITNLRLILKDIKYLSKFFNILLSYEEKILSLKGNA
jgi:O-antigen/teichoic acid export membrane protein